MSKTRWTKLLSLCLVFLLAAAVFAGCGGDPTGTGTPATTNEPAATDPAGTDDGGAADSGAEDGGTTEMLDTFPRNETLYFNGLQWGAPTNFNPFASAPGTFMTINDPVPRVVIYETMFVYNQLDGQFHGLLGLDYSWNDYELTITLNPDAHWNDGQPVTAEDVVYTYELGNKYSLWISSIWSYIDGIAATDEHTVVITADSANFNPKEVEESIGMYYIVPKHVWEQYEEEVGNDGAELMQLVNDDPVASGPYKIYSYDDTKMAVVRDDNYWGQADSLYGSLPAPKYLVHNIFKDNASGDAAFKAGEVDVSQQFVSQIWLMWENDGLPIETYLPDAPYYIPGSIPSIVFNTTVDGLDDPVVRKAIARALDYDLIGQNAMSGYTAPMSPSMMLPIDTEQALIDTAALAEYQWTGVQIDEANAMLDEAGWVAGSDGIREKDGVRLSYQVQCPSGWTDWMASLEVVSQSTKAIGIDIQTYFPEYAVWVNDRNTGNFDILMNTYAGAGIASPWSRARQTMSSVEVAPVGETSYHNYGRYHNDRANELIELLMTESDPVKEKEYWTELNSIYLDEMPAAGLMYRPRVFHQVNTSVWDGFPRINDGSNIPPDICVDGYGIAALYHIYAK